MLAGVTFIPGACGVVGGVIGTVKNVIDIATAENVTARDNARDMGIAGVWAATAVLGVFLLRKADGFIERFAENAQAVRALHNTRDDQKTGLLNEIDARLKMLEPR